MKDIKQIQEENRKIILEAIHGVSYEEALEREFLEAISQITLFTGYKGSFEDVQNWIRSKGRPITLSRVLFAAKNSAIIPTAYWATRDYIVHVWDLSKETLEEQSEETQRAVWELLTGNE